MQNHTHSSMAEALSVIVSMKSVRSHLLRGLIFSAVMVLAVPAWGQVAGLSVTINEDSVQDGVSPDNARPRAVRAIGTVQNPADRLRAVANPSPDEEREGYELVGGRLVPVGEFRRDGLELEQFFVDSGLPQFIVGEDGANNVRFQINAVVGENVQGYRYEGTIVYVRYHDGDGDGEFNDRMVVDNNVANVVIEVNQVNDEPEIRACQYFNDARCIPISEGEHVSGEETNGTVTLVVTLNSHGAAGNLRETYVVGRETVTLTPELRVRDENGMPGAPRYFSETGRLTFLSTHDNTDYTFTIAEDMGFQGQQSSSRELTVEYRTDLVDITTNATLTLRDEGALSDPGQTLTAELSFIVSPRPDLDVNDTNGDTPNVVIREGDRPAALTLATGYTVVGNRDDVTATLLSLTGATDQFQFNSRDLIYRDGEIIWPAVRGIADPRSNVEMMGVVELTVENTQEFYRIGYVTVSLRNELDFVARPSPARVGLRPTWDTETLTMELTKDVTTPLIVGWRMEVSLTHENLTLLGDTSAASSTPVANVRAFSFDGDSAVMESNINLASQTADAVQTISMTDTYMMGGDRGRVQIQIPLRLLRPWRSVNEIHTLQLRHHVTYSGEGIDEMTRTERSDIVVTPVAVFTQVGEDDNTGMIDLTIQEDDNPGEITLANNMRLYPLGDAANDARYFAQVMEVSVEVENGEANPFLSGFRRSDMRLVDGALVINPVLQGRRFGVVTATYFVQPGVRGQLANIVQRQTIAVLTITVEQVIDAPRLDIIDPADNTGGQLVFLQNGRTVATGQENGLIIRNVAGADQAVQFDIGEMLLEEGGTHVSVHLANPRVFPSNAVLFKPLERIAGVAVEPRVTSESLMQDGRSVTVRLFYTTAEEAPIAPPPAPPPVEPTEPTVPTTGTQSPVPGPGEEEEQTPPDLLEGPGTGVGPTGGHYEAALVQTYTHVDGDGDTVTVQATIGMLTLVFPGPNAENPYTLAEFSVDDEARFSETSPHRVRLELPAVFNARYSVSYVRMSGQGQEIEEATVITASPVDDDADGYVNFDFVGDDPALPRFAPGGVYVFQAVVELQDGEGSQVVLLENRQVTIDAPRRDLYGNVYNPGACGGNDYPDILDDTDGDGLTDIREALIGTDCSSDASRFAGAEPPPELVLAQALNYRAGVSRPMPLANVCGATSRRVVPAAPSTRTEVAETVSVPGAIACREFVTNGVLSVFAGETRISDRQYVYLDTSHNEDFTVRAMDRHGNPVEATVSGGYMATESDIWLNVHSARVLRGSGQMVVAHVSMRLHDTSQSFTLATDQPSGVYGSDLDEVGCTVNEQDKRCYLRSVVGNVGELVDEEISVDPSSGSGALDLTLVYNGTVVDTMTVDQVINDAVLDMGAARDWIAVGELSRAFITLSAIVEPNNQATQIFMASYLGIPGASTANEFTMQGDAIGRSTLDIRGVSGRGPVTLLVQWLLHVEGEEPVVRKEWRFAWNSIESSSSSNGIDNANRMTVDAGLIFPGALAARAGENPPYGYTIEDSEAVADTVFNGNRPGDSSFAVGTESEALVIYDYRAARSESLGNRVRYVAARLPSDTGSGAYIALKYRPEIGWFPFVRNQRNEIYWARGGLDDNCPAPADPEDSEWYTPNVGNENCVMFVIMDGGENDDDEFDSANGVVLDPIALVRVGEAGETDSPTVRRVGGGGGGGGGAVTPLSLALLASLAVLMLASASVRARRRRVRVRR